MTYIRPDEKLNLEGITCPQNAATALLRLEGMKCGAILEIIIDDGEPIKNVPVAIEEEGHKIISTAKSGNKWKLFIKRV